MLDAERRTVATAVSRLARLTPGRTGNLSVRRDDHVAITPSGVPYDRIDAANVPVVDADGRVHGDDFEETEWGYVKSDYESPTGEDRPVVVTADGYTQGSPTHYLRMRDGALVAVTVTKEDHVWRAPPGLPDEYVCAHLSLRGTGCSGGTFDLYSQTQALDGYETVEWLADREWSLDRVGLYGGSYSGFTAFFIAATQPPSLAAVSANMLTADLYRGVVFPGGVPNTVFPSFWALGRRPSSDYQSAAEGAQAQDEICMQNITTRGQHNPTHEEATWYAHRTDDALWRSRSLITYAEKVEVPTYIANAWQDEQTGPRGGPELFDAISPAPASPPGEPGPTPGEDHPSEGRGPPTAAQRNLAAHDEPKLLRGTNGVHSTAFSVADDDAARWFEYWLRGKETGIMDESPVEFHVNRGTDSEATLGFDGYPVPESDWTRYYLREGEALSTTAPGDEAPDRYVTGSPRQSWFFEAPEAGSRPAMAEGPDVLTYTSEAVEEPRIVAGPITATLYIETTAPEMDLFVRIADRNAETGQITPLQRGLLRASHRELDEDRTLYNHAGDIVRPYRPHTNPEPVTPGEVTRYDVEVFPLGHVLYPGHRLVVRVHTPPATDGLSGYEPSRAPGVNTVYHDSEHPSSVLFPMVDWPEDQPLPPEPACGGPDGYRCLDGYADPAGTGSGLPDAPAGTLGSGPTGTLDGADR